MTQPVDFPIRQRDHGTNHRARGSSSAVVKIEGGSIAIAIALVALGGVLVCAILLPQLMEKTAQSAAAPASVRSQISEREARVAQDQVANLRVDVETLKGARK